MRIAIVRSRLYLPLAIVCLVIHLITAGNSSGYHSADEHHQIIEFAEFKLGELPPGHMAWEYSTGIRSSIQPWIAAGTMIASRAIGLTEPLYQAFLLRLFSALLAILALIAFVRVSTEQIPTDLQLPFVMLSVGLWFLPFLHVRFNSEGWSASFLLLGLSFLLQRSGNRSGWAWITGSALAIAVLLRPSTFVVIAGALSWSIMIRRLPPKDLLRIILAAAFMVFLGFIADSLYYDRWLLSTWNYGIMAFSGPPRMAFDTLPWYYYPPWVVKYALPPIGGVILIAYVIVLIKQPRHLVIWCITPLLLTLTIIPHKELRFLYPLADLMPLSIILAAIQVRPFLQRIPSAVRVFLMGAFILPNAVALLVVMLTPAGNGVTDLVPILRFGAVTYIEHPASVWSIKAPPFYRKPIEGDTAVAIDAINSPLLTPYVMVRTTELDQLKASTGQHFQPMARTRSHWEEELMRLYSWNEREPPWILCSVDRKSNETKIR